MWKYYHSLVSLILLFIVFFIGHILFIQNNLIGLDTSDENFLLFEWSEGKTNGFQTSGSISTDYLLESMYNFKDSISPSWTYMLYLDADNDIESDAIKNFEELEQGGGSNDNISVIVLFDRNPNYDSSHGNWSGSRL